MSFFTTARTNSAVPVRIRFFLLFYSLIFSHWTFGQSTFTGGFNEPGIPKLYSINPTTDGGFVMAWQHDVLGSGIVKTNGLGSSEWATRTGYGEEGVAQTPDGGYVVGGQTDHFGTGGEYSYLYKTDSIGNILWFKTYLDSVQSDFGALAVTSDGGYVFYTFSRVVKTDEDGNVQWAKGYSMRIRDLQQTADGGYVIAGWSGANGVGARLDSVGEKIWSTGVAYDFIDGFDGCAELNDGKVVFGGIFTLPPGIHSSSILLMFSPDGTYLKGRSGSGGFTPSVDRIVPTTDGGFATYTSSGFQLGSATTQGAGKYDSNGNGVGRILLPGGIGPNYRVSGMCATPDGGFAVSYFGQNNSSFPIDAGAYFAKYSPLPSPCSFPNGGSWGCFLPQLGHGVITAPYTVVPQVWPVGITTRFNISLENDCALCHAVSVPDFDWFNAGPSVEFYDRSENANGWYWEFGDGEVASVKNPVHVYPAIGTYTVCLTVYGICDTTSTCKTLDLCEFADFSGGPWVCPSTPFTFTNTSGGGIGSEWFVDGVSVSTGTDLTHSFSVMGPSVVRLIEQNGTCADTTEQVVQIGNNFPVADFNMFRDGRQVILNSTASYVNSLLWDFGDGNTDSIQDTEHTYASFDTVDVCLSIENGCGTDTHCEQYACSEVEADFEVTINPNSVNLVSTTPDAVNWQWDLGDGTFAAGSVVSHSYSSTGQYNVCLTASNGCRTSQICQEVEFLAEGEAPLFVRTCTGGGYFRGEKIIVTADGGYFIIGRVNGSIAYWKFDQAHNLEWGHRVFGAGNEIPEGAIQTSDGGLLISGRSSMSIGTDYNAFLIKTDPMGGVQWMKTYGGSTYIQHGGDLFEMPNGDFIATGRSDDYWADSSLFVMRVNTSGDVIWFKTYDTWSDVNQALRFFDTGILLMGNVGDIIKINFDGDVQWAIGDPNTSLGLVSSVLTQNGELVTALINPIGFEIRRHDTLGNTIWQRGYDQSLGSDPFLDLIMEGIIERSDSEFVVFGSVEEEDGYYLGGGYDGFIMSIDGHSGDQNWTRLYGGTGSDHIRDAVQTPDGGILACGRTASFGNLLEMFVVKTDLLGHTECCFEMDYSFYDDAVVYPLQSMNVTPTNRSVVGQPFLFQDSMLVTNCRNICLSGCARPTADFSHTLTQDTLVASGIPSGAPEYWWEFGDGTTGTSLNETHIYSGPGKYEVCFYTKNDCGINSKCDSVEVMLLVSEDEKTEREMIQVYPNPVRDGFFVEMKGLTAKKARIELIDGMGKVLSTREGVDPALSKTFIPTRELSAGIYLVNISAQDKKYVRKIQVMK